MSGANIFDRLEEVSRTHSGHSKSPADIHSALDLIRQLGRSQERIQNLAAGSASPALPPAPTDIEDHRSVHAVMLPRMAHREIFPGNIRFVDGHEIAPEVIFMTGPMSGARLKASIDPLSLAVRPIIDLGGKENPVADFTLNNFSPFALNEVLQKCDAINVRLSQILPQGATAFDPEFALLARLHSRSGSLTPRYHPEDRAAIHYPEEILLGPIRPLAEKLIRSGFLEARFFDRIHICPACHSARLNVREECRNCRSADIEELNIIHHYKCGHQAPESDFSRNGDLICPKCSRTLNHFSVDYDKPGSVMACRACGHNSNSSTVGFTCFDCGAHHDSEHMQTRTYSSYLLTEEGQVALWSGLAGAAAAQETELQRFTNEARELAAARTIDGKPFCLMRISCNKKEEIIAREGVRAFENSCRLFSRALHEIMRKEHRIFEHEYSFYILLSNVSAAETRKGTAYIKKEATRHLRLDLGIVIEVLDADEAINCLEREAS